MSIGLGILGASGKTAFAFVGQRGLRYFDEHPFLDVRALIADDPADVGKTLAEAVRGRWLDDRPIPERFADMVMVGIDKEALESAGVELILSALPGPHARQVDPQLAEMGFPVVSESAGLRQEPDVPLIVPDVNADHLPLVLQQRSTSGWERGWIVASPVCTAVIAAVAVKPVVDAFGLNAAVFTTLQALSGAGPTGVPGMYVVDNVMPFIADEEDKLVKELHKILGRFTGEAIEPLAAPIAATCTRIAVRDGHTESITLGLGREASIDEVADAIASYRGRAQELELPSAPAIPLVVRSEIDRPQPQLDRDVDGGRVVSVGRIRRHDAFENGISFVAVGHNHDRGTVGNAVILTELVAQEGLSLRH
ncbi:aspartate-semialdehyde dehydrogenase [soil metagenome]